MSTGIDNSAPYTATDRVTYLRSKLLSVQGQLHSIGQHYTTSRALLLNASMHVDLIIEALNKKELDRASEITREIKKLLDKNGFGKKGK